ncbi:MAG: hypothetical protein H7Z15_07925 [Rhizobacter sp.]|nr:hypothetical protein [Rhizobacter sp.]
MSRRPLSTRFALWLAMCALLLKAAVPMLASVSAQAQGKTLVEVCTVYGVATVAIDEPGSQPAPVHTPPHSGDHCTLTAQMAFAAPEAQPLAAPAVHRGASTVLSHPSPQAPDACATWVSRLKHGPPAFA